LVKNWGSLAILFSSIKESTMARVSTYLNFPGKAEEAFTFYAQVFGTEVSMLQRFSDMAIPGGPQLSEEEQSLILHAEVETLGGHLLMATDILPSMGQEFRVGNNVTLNLEPDTKEDADRRLAASFKPLPKTLNDRIAVAWRRATGRK
jgi:PhnB protein